LKQRRRSRENNGCPLFSAVTEAFFKAKERESVKCFEKGKKKSPMARHNKKAGFTCLFVICWERKNEKNEFIKKPICYENVHKNVQSIVW